MLIFFAFCSLPINHLKQTYKTTNRTDYTNKRKKMFVKFVRFVVK
jgi:hypothetical protein